MLPTVSLPMLCSVCSEAMGNNILLKREDLQVGASLLLCLAVGYAVLCSLLCCAFIVQNAAVRQPRCSTTGLLSLLRTHSLQPVKSFKLRGAYNKMAQLTPEQVRAPRALCWHSGSACLAAPRLCCSHAGAAPCTSLRSQAPLPLLTCLLPAVH